MSFSGSILQKNLMSPNAVEGTVIQFFVKSKLGRGWCVCPLCYWFQDCTTDVVTSKNWLVSLWSGCWWAFPWKYDFELINSIILDAICLPQFPICLYFTLFRRRSKIVSSNFFLAALPLGASENKLCFCHKQLEILLCPLFQSTSFACLYFCSQSERNMSIQVYLFYLRHIVLIRINTHSIIFDLIFLHLVIYYAHMKSLSVT